MSRLAHLVVNPERKSLAWIGHLGGIAKAVDSKSAYEFRSMSTRLTAVQREVRHTDWWEKDFNIAASNQLQRPSRQEKKRLFCLVSKLDMIVLTLPLDSCHQCIRIEISARYPRLKSFLSTDSHEW